jgi:hypothetical protein
LSLSPTATLYRRERWETPDGAAIVAELAPGIVGGYGPNLHRLILMLSTQGQMTCERILALLNDMGVVISKRQVVRLLTTKLEIFRDEDEAVLKAGIVGDYVMVDDTGARHAGKNGYATQIGSNRFSRVSQRSEQIAAGFPVSALWRNLALRDQSGRARIHG